MFPRLAPALAASLAVILVAGCAGASSGAAGPGGKPPPVPTSSAPIAHAPTPTPIVAPSTPAVTPDPTDRPNTGAVGGLTGGPELSIEPVDDHTIEASIQDSEAKAWRVVVAGTGDRAGDRWEITVETGDSGPAISATEIVGGEIVDVMDLSGFTDGTAAAGGCHSTLGICLDSDGFRIPDGDGVFSVRLDLDGAQAPLLVRGGTATWDGEPFILGEWHDTATFPWG